MKLSYKDLPPKTRAAIDEIVELKKENKSKWTSCDTVMYAKVGSLANAFVIDNFLRKEENSYSLSLWLDGLSCYSMLTDEIEEELMPYVFGENEVND